MLKIFKSNQPFVNVIVVLITIALGLPVFFTEPTVVDANLFRFSKFFNSVNNTSWLRYILWCIFTIGIGYYLNYVVNQYKLVNNNTHVPFIIYVVLQTLFPSALIFSPTQIITVFILFILHQSNELYNTRKETLKTFNLGFFMGLAAILYLPIGFLMLLVWFIMRYYKPPYWKEYIVSLIGVIVPFVYLFAYYFIFNKFSVDNILFIETAETSAPINESWSLNQLLFFIKMGLIFLYALWHFVIATQKSVVRVRKYRSVMLLLILGIVLQHFIFLKNTTINADFFALLSIPLSLIIGNLLIEIKKKWIAETVFYLLLLLIIANYIS
ncbi:MAG: DUF6427 family protein [Vicingaceae bacterium]|nr:DUF6427 family protein [Vicingaceae bacterium]